MSYLTSFHGRIEIDPPIPYGLFKDSPHHHRRAALKAVR